MAGIIVYFKRKPRSKIDDLVASMAATKPVAVVDRTLVAPSTAARSQVPSDGSVIPVPRNRNKKSTPAN